MDLLVVRHAIAMERDPKRWPDDRLRPLSTRGSSRGRKAAAGIQRLGFSPELVLASPLVRAQQTAQILQRYARWPPAQAWTELAPDTPARALLGRLGRSAAACIAVIGHEPQLSALLGECLPGGSASQFTFARWAPHCCAFVAGHGPAADSWSGSRPRGCCARRAGAATS